MPASSLQRWNRTDTERLVELHNQGQSYGLIAIEMKRTRNSVIGKGHRIGLVGGAPKKVMQKQVSTKPAKVATCAKKQPLIFKSSLANRKSPSIELITKADNHTAVGVKISKLEWSDGRPINCRAILRGEGKDAIYCGKDNEYGSSYCPEHTEKFHHRPVGGYRPPKMDFR